MNTLLNSDSLLTKEGKQVGDLYHACTFKSMLHIANTDTLSPGLNANVVNMKRTVSFTRNPNFVVDTIGNTPVLFILTIDGDKLSEHYKTQPFAHSQYRDAISDEFEEVAVGKINDLSSYIKAVRIFFFENKNNQGRSYLESLDTIFSYLNNHNIPLDTHHPLSNLKGLSQTIFTGNTIKDYLDRVQHILFFYDNVENTLSNIEPLFDDSGTGFLMNDELKPVKKYKASILALIKRWESMLDAKAIITTMNGDKTKRKPSEKLETVLNNSSYTIDSLSYSATVDLNSPTPYSPYITLHLYNSKELPIKYNISFSF